MNLWHHYRVREALIAVGIFVGVALLALVVSIDPVLVMATGKTVMVGAVWFAFPFELLYFAGLGLAVRRAGGSRGWYWRSFEHHDKLGPKEKWVWLSCFALGSIGMLLASLAVVAVFACILASLRTSA